MLRIPPLAALRSRGPSICNNICTHRQTVQTQTSFSQRNDLVRNSVTLSHKWNPNLGVCSVSSLRHFHVGSSTAGIFSPKEDISFWGRTLKRLGFTDIPKSILMASGYKLYMKTADELDYLKFFQHCDLPDTYASWFIVVELHVWLLCAKLMQHDDVGKIVRNSLVKAMWDDNQLKSKQLDGALPSARRKELSLLGSQFRAALFGYDEGLMGDDHVLAGALWRRILQHSETDTKIASGDPNHFKLASAQDHEALARKVKALEMLVIYVRSQYYMLNNLSREQLIRKRAFKWAPFDDSLYDLVGQYEGVSERSKDSLKLR